MIEVRLLTGQRYSVQLPGDATVGDLKAALASQHGLSSCRLNHRVSRCLPRWALNCAGLPGRFCCRRPAAASIILPAPPGLPRPGLLS